MSRDELLHRMTVLLAGRAAEALVFGQVSTGASDDLVRTTDIARSMVVRFGMDAKLGLVAYEPERQRFLPGREAQARAYSEDTAASIDDAVRTLVEGAYAVAQHILAANEALLRQSAAQLLETETLAGDQLAAISTVVNRAPLEPPRLPAPIAA